MEKQFDIENLHCSYDKGLTASSKVVLEIDRLVIPRGKTVFIVGESGIGKSTILEVLGMMNNTIVPTPGMRFVYYEGEKSFDLIEMWRRNDDEELSSFRLKYFSFIFQSTNLMRNFTAFENIALTRMLQGYSQGECFEKTRELLSDLGLGHIDDTRMAQELSGGQQQRLTFARAILPDFSVLFGDEPTGNLDGDNAVKAMELLAAKLNTYPDSSAVIVSHDMHLATSFADMIILIRKHARKELNKHGEVDFYGRIDESSVFFPDDKRESWSNGPESFGTEAFEYYLKKGGQA